MEWVEWLLSREFRQFILDNNLFFPLLFVGRFIGVTALELLVPARRVSYRSVLWLDIIGATFLVYFTTPAASFLSSFLAVRPVVPEAILTLPAAEIFLLYYVVGDFGAYWMHRFWHLSLVWRVHKWHHSPASMYWLAGYRASILQLTLQNLPWMFAYAIGWRHLLVPAARRALRLRFSSRNSAYGCDSVRPSLVMAHSSSVGS